MASKKIFFALFFVTFVLIICYVYLDSKTTGTIFRGHTEARGVVALGKRIFGSGNEPNNNNIDSSSLVSRKPKVDWKEYWRHLDERKIMGFQEKNNIFEKDEEVATQDVTVNNPVKNNALKVKEELVQQNKKATLTGITFPDGNKPTEKKALSKKKWLYDWNETKDMVDSLPLYGNWQNELGQRIIFNRVGKCGSRSVLDVFKHLAKQNHYNMINSIVYNQTRISEEKKNLIVSVLLKVDPPFLFQRHMYYVDFSKFSSSSVKYINIIRDPIERFTSQYYFKRFGDGKNDQSQRQFKGFLQTINECVLKNRPECGTKKLQYIIPFFCGHSPQCRLPGRTPLEMAKLNVERDFIVVGVLEELDDTFAVLEKMLPRFFTGAVEYLRSPDTSSAGNTFARNRSATVTKHKEVPSDEVRTILLKQMSLEYEFYYYIKDRFQKLKIQLGIGDSKQ
ncbi:uronyl 2-sulfotransferase-like [Anneissia japonica]|uniref:uronyl 2-sulfotransferase-like n=1 Tax=Anneissia japonica TaxID=1529436 RepID=UPI001425B44B|nr:uronyl 2-sulfotransferase-like [Anneissia japonica]